MSCPLTDTQHAVVNRVLEEEGRQRDHLVVAISGAHAYGFASADSDVDIKAIHVDPTDTFLGLGGPSRTRDRLEVIDGVEIDYTSNEIAVALRGVLQGNGNMLERIVPEPLAAKDVLDELRQLVLRNLSRRVHRHYRGFAANQQADIGDAPMLKKVLYVLRTTLTGTHALEAGEIVPDLTALCDEYGFSEAHELVRLKRDAEHGLVPEALRPTIPQLLDRAFERLDMALARSPLPVDPPDPAGIEAWLIELRRSQ